MSTEKRALPLRTYWRLLVDYLRPQRGRMVLLTLLAFTSIGLALANPQIVRFFLDTAETQTGLDRLFGAAALFMAAALLRQAAQLALTYVGENVAWSATNLLRADLARHILKLDMSFHKQYKPGELIERVDGDVNQLANFFSQLVVRLGGNLLLTIGVLVLLFLQDWRIGLGISAAAGVGLLALDYLNKRTVPRWQAVREVEARLFGFIEEWLNGAEEIQTSGAKPYIMLRLYQALRARWQKILYAMRLQVLVADLPTGVFALAYVAAHLVGNSLFQDGGMSIGELYLIFYYLDVLKGPLWDILRQIEDLQRAAASINRIADLRQIQPTLLDGPGAPFPDGPLGVRFDAVTFQYEDDQETDILSDLSFDLAPGRSLGLLGRTGSGKTTLTKLLFRFHDPAQGAVMLGNGRLYDIRQATQSGLRARIGMVTQEVQLFQATVRQNLTLFDDTVPDSQIRAAVEAVGLEDWLAGLPAGLDTTLDAGGGGLSAGEAQLLAFGRVFLTDPGLVILDEASSRLDPATEARLEQAVDRLLEGRTAIIIAHRLATVGRTDEILILEDGRIAEYGERTELLQDPSSLFSKLLQTGLEAALA